MSIYSSLNDQDLLVLLKKDNETAFQELYERYKGILHVHAYKKLGDFEEAKDVVQELFAALWDKRLALPETTNFAGYLYSGIRNRIFNIFAHNDVKSRYAASFQQYNSEMTFTTDESVRAVELAAQIEREINVLPQKMREVFLLSRQENLSHKEIAERLSISEQTSRNHIKKALKVLRNRLDTLVYIFFY